MTNIGEVELANVIATPYQFSFAATGSLVTPTFPLVKGAKITPSQLTTSTNDFSPTGLNATAIIELTADTSFPAIGGLTAQNSGTYIDLINTGSNTILLSDENTTLGQASTAANRFAFNGYDIPLFPKSLVTVMYNGTLSRWISPHTLNPVLPPTRFGFRYAADFPTSNANPIYTLTAASGGSTSNVAGTPRHFGARNFSLGTSTTGSGSVFPGGNDVIGPLGNNQYWRFDFGLKVLQLSNGTDNYTLRVGFIDTATVESTDGAFFRYNHAVNSGKWERVTRNNGSETGTALDTGVTVGTTNFTQLTVIVDPLGHNAQFFIDGVSVGTNTANIPTGAGRNTSYGMMFLKSAGTTDTEFLTVDSIQILTYSNIARTT